MSNRTPGHWVRAFCLGGLLLVPTSCGSSYDPIPAASFAPLVVASMQPASFVGYQSIPFTLTGSGFSRGETPWWQKPGLPAPGNVVPPVVITFVATDGTPFLDGTAAQVDVPGTVISDTEIQGLSPLTNQPGGWTATVTVTDALGSGSSTEPLSVFLGLTVFAIDRPVIRADKATPFEVTGLAFLPVGGQATVRFISLAPEFPGGSTTLDVVVDVVDATKVAGVTPIFPLATEVPALVRVILHQEPGSPQASAYVVLTIFVPPPPIPVVVVDMPTPVPLDLSTPFTLTGSGFLGAGGDPDVQVRFDATVGTPFLRGTASSVTVLGTATSDGTVTGMSPVGTALADVTAFVTVTRIDAIAGTSATDIATFVAPAASIGRFTPDVIPADTSTPFSMEGANLPAGQPATVRFRAVSGTPFVGGTSATTTVVATVTSTTQIDGMSPLAVTSVEFLCETDVILQSGTELYLGPSCEYTPPAAPPPMLDCIVTNLDDSGVGSLRDRILNAPLDCIITFDPALSGNLTVDSTLLVPHDIHIVAPGAEVIRIRTQQGNFPVFTIAPAATDSTIELLAIEGSDHDGDGGGFLVRGGLTLLRCELRDHRIDGGGGAVFVAAGGVLNMLECTLEDNQAEGRGGAIFVETGGAAYVVGCTLNDNEAGAGGGAIGLDPNAIVDLQNCTLHHNDASGGPGGGGVLVASNTVVTMVHCTLTDNTTRGEGGGVLIQNGELVATNCIFSRNADGRGSPEIGKRNGLNTTTFSLVRVGAGSGLSLGQLGNLVGTANTPIDPNLGSLQTNGGPTRTRMPQQGSPVVDVASGAACLPTDQRTVLRPSGPACDMGACEADPFLL